MHRHKARASLPQIPPVSRVAVLVKNGVCAVLPVGFAVPMANFGWIVCPARMLRCLWAASSVLLRCLGANIIDSGED